MNVPSIPVDKIVNEKGDMSEIWFTFFQQLTQLMQQNLSDEGFLIPQLSTNDILQLTDPSKTPNGTLIYDSTTNQFKGKVNGSFVVIS